MNILLVNHYAGSPQHGMEVRHFYLGEEWVKLGHKVTIVAASFTHLRSMTGKSRVQRSLISEEQVENVRYIWLKTPKYLGNGIGRILNMLAFTVLLYLKARAICDSVKPDLVIASSPHPFVIFGSRKIARLAVARLFFEIRDLWGPTLNDLANLSSRHPLRMIMESTETMAFRVADRVLSMLPRADRYMVSCGVSSDKFAYAPIGADGLATGNESISIPESHGQILADLRKSGRFIVAYLGLYGVGASMAVLLEAADILRDREVSVVLVGDGPEKNALQQKARELRLKNVFFLPPIQRKAIPDFLSCIDAAYVGFFDRPIYQYGISPNKLMDYMKAARPIISAIRAGNDPVAESGCGISLPPENTGALADAILRLMAMSASEREAMGEKGRKYVAARHDYGIIAQQFLDLVS